MLASGKSGTSLIVYGSFLIIAILFMPRGITGIIQKPYLKLRRRLLAESKS
jgi:ABC-type branched-subunit amino acid transport system permease subunit